MKKKYTRALAAALAAVMIWNTCDWHPQVLAGSSVQYIEEVKELSEEILHQEVPYGTKYKDLELPDKLKVRVLKEDAKEDASDTDERNNEIDGEETKATASEISMRGMGEETLNVENSENLENFPKENSPKEENVGVYLVDELQNQNENGGNVEAQEASPSEMNEEDKDASKASPSDADDTSSDGKWKEVKVRWVLDETFSEKEKYDGKTPGVYVFDAELKNSRYELGSGFLPRIEVTVLPEEKGPTITGFSALDESIAMQNLPLGAKESDIILPDTLDVEVEDADETLAEDSRNVHLVEVANEGTEEEAGAEKAVWQISGVTWKLDEDQSDLPEFHGGISEKDYFEEFDENGAPVETSEKTWAGYTEVNQEYNGRVYVYRAVLPDDLGKFEAADTADLPEIYVMVGDAGVALLADAPYDLNGNYLVIDKNNVAQFKGKTITGTYHPTERLSGGRTIEGGIVIDDVTVDLTIKDVNVGYGTDIIDNAAGILLKGKATLNLTVEGENTLTGTYGGAGIGVEENATLVITKESSGSLTATGGGLGAAGIGGRASKPSDGQVKKYKTGTIEIRGGSIHAVGGDYWLSSSTVRLGGAGIGTGIYGIGGTVRILGGTVKAEGGMHTGAGIGGGENGSVDLIEIGGKNGEAPEVEAISFNVEYGAAIGSGYNSLYNLKLSCGTINIFSGNLKIKGNIGYGGVTKSGDNEQKGGNVDISEQVKLELKDGTIEPRGACTFGKKTFQMTVYDNQLSDGNYNVNIQIYQEKDTGRSTPVYETNSEMKVTAFKGTIPDITEWIGFSGNMPVVVEVTDSQNKTVTETGTAVLNAGKDEKIPVTLGKEAYKKTLDLTIYDGRLKNNQNYTLTVQVGDPNESGVLPDILTYSDKKASNYQLSAGKVSWYSSLNGEEIPVRVTIQESGENEPAYTVSGMLDLKGEEETALSLSIGEKLYPVHFLFYSPQVQNTDQVVLRAKRTDASGAGTPVELSKDLGQFVFDGKLVKDISNEDSAVAAAYLPAGEYQFEIETGIAGLGESNGQFMLNQKTVNANEAGTEIVVLNEMKTFEGELDLSQGDITFSEQGGNLVISYYQKEADSTESTLKTVPGQSYDTVYTIVTSKADTTNVLKVDTSATREVKIVVKDIHLQASAAAASDAAPIQINGSSHVFMYLEGENEIQVQKQNDSRSDAPAGISVARDAQITIDCKPDADGLLKVESQAVNNSGAAIGGAPEMDAGTIIINGGTITAKLLGESYAAAIGSSYDKCIQKIQINAGTVEVKTESSYGAAIGSGGMRWTASRAQIYITGGKINVNARGGASIGSGRGSNATVKIDGGMITAYSWQGASIGSGAYGSSQTEINGGTFCLNRNKQTDSKLSDIGPGVSGKEAEVIINGGTFYMVENDGRFYTRAPLIRSLKKDSSGNLNLENPLNRDGTPVYCTKADLSDIYGANGVIKNASIDVPSYNYGFNDAQTAPNGIVYIYLPAADSVKADFNGAAYEGAVTAGASNNVLTREADRISVDIAWGSMEFTYSDGTWNPETYTYENVGWKPASEGGNKISVTNHSNVKILAAYHFTKTSDGENGVDPELATWFDGFSGKLTADADGSGAEVSEETLKAGTAGSGTGTSSSVYLNLFSEKPVREFNQLPLGTVTVQITKPAA